MQHKKISIVVTINYRHLMRNKQFNILIIQHNTVAPVTQL